MADVEHTLARSKGKILHLPMRPSVSIMHRGPAAFSEAASAGLSMPHIKNMALSGQITPEQAAAAEKLLGQVTGKITMPRRTGGVVGLMRGVGMPAARNMPGEARKATEAIIRGHEMNEMAMAARGVKEQRFPLTTGHVHPEVLLREHNQISTLPGGVREPVQGLFGQMRADIEQPLFESATRGVGGQGMQLGQGQRLSRHARRRISDRMQQLVAEPGMPTVAERMAAQ